MQRKAIRLTAAIAALLVCAVVGQAGQAPKVDVTGEWILTVESAAGSSNPTVTFKQDGEKLTGHYSSQLLGEAELTGTIKGQAIEFIVAADVQGTKIQLKYTGAVEGKDSMKGTLSAGEFGDGAFTGKRK